MSDTSIWLDGIDAAPTAPVELPERSDVVVVGAGLAGLCVALLCAEGARSVTVIEGGAIAHRTTGHSTAKLTALHGLTYAELSRGKGTEAAAVYAAGNMAALAKFRQLDCRSRHRLPTHRVRRVHVRRHRCRHRGNRARGRGRQTCRVAGRCHLVDRTRNARQARREVARPSAFRPLRVLPGPRRAPANSWCHDHRELPA